MSFDHPHAHTICREVMTYASGARYRTDIVQDIAKIVLSKNSRHRDLDSTSDWTKQSFNQSDLGRDAFLHLFLRRQFAGKLAKAYRNIGCFRAQALNPIRSLFSACTSCKQ